LRWILGACLTSEDVLGYVCVKWCLHGVHCEPEKSSLHPSPRRLLCLGLHLVWMEFIVASILSPQNVLRRDYAI